MITDKAKSLIADYIVTTFTRANVGSGGNNTSPAQLTLDVPLLANSGASYVIDFKITILGSDASITGRTIREISINGETSDNHMFLRVPFDAIGPFSSSEEIEFFIAVEIE